MTLRFDKLDGLLPAVIQDVRTAKVLMVGFMNEEAWTKTKAEGKVTFFSREKKRLWTKGETSGNFLLVKEILTDCDRDTLLIKAEPVGPVCHTGAETCFNEANLDSYKFLESLQALISDRRDNPKAGSYVSGLFADGTKRIAQKVGEEGVEVALEACMGDRERLKGEAADLLFHLTVLLIDSGLGIEDVVAVLKSRHK